MTLLLPLLAAAALGAIFGSFLNAVIWRTREDRLISRGRSICPHCEVQISWIDNIPVISFLILSGKCRHCQGVISLQYPIVEAITALLFVFVVWFHGAASWEIIFRDWFIIWYLLFIFVYDYLYQEIPDRASLVPALILFVLSGVTGWMGWGKMLLAAVIGSGFFSLQYAVSKGRWIGGGDIRLGLLMGIILGWPFILVALLLAYVVGAVIAVGLLLARSKGMQSEIAFGTFLTFATFVTMFWGEGILTWYLNLL